jgi:hypothetical protein
VHSSAGDVQLSANAYRVCAHMQLRKQQAVTPQKLAFANPVELLAIYPFKPTCDQMGNHLYKNIKVNARKGE